MTQFFTHEIKSPSEKTLEIIRQIARNYRGVCINGEYKVLCLS